VVKQPFNNDSNEPTILEVLRAGEQALKEISASPRLDSEVLLRYVLGLSQSGLIIAFPELCPAETSERFQSLVRRRASGEPVAYILGEREFWGLSFRVTPDVLVPRPETEIIVEHAVKELRGRQTAHILDLGTGSGCIAIACVKELQQSGCQRVSSDAVDCSATALAVARENAARHGVADVVRFVQGFWCREVSTLRPPYDCIVANPPYIDPREQTPIELSYEPRSALFSEAGGLADTAEIMRSALPLLTPGGVLLCEVGAGKAALIEGVMAPYRADFDVAYLGDLSDQDRFRVVRVTRNRQGLCQGE
jgi:release factor glutamine methyltransferase